MIGQSISHYRVTAKLGQGGIGAVYQATDTKLDREVAIKVLPDSFAQDKERLARFEREAKVLTTLNHPTIAGIFGMEQSDVTQALILELVEGEDLSERLRGGLLPVDEALDICKQIAEALEAAHEKGIIHRDLKPGNIKLLPNGKVKVLDFGLAKALSDEPNASAISNPEDSPTITDAFTGTILGTAAYMSPEQARGKHVDERADIWAFGCVLFECLTGKKAFHGEDATETLAGIIKGEPDWVALQASTPLSIQLLLRKCLAKDRKKRLQHIDDARVDLEQAIDDPARLQTVPSNPTMEPRHAAKSFTWAVALIASLTVAILTWFMKSGLPSDQTTPLPIRHLGIDFELPHHIAGAGGVAARLSPDGSTLAYLVGDHYPQFAKLYLRPLHQLKAKELKEAEGVLDFCFSPDGQHIAFRRGGARKLEIVSVSGGASTEICHSGITMGIDWTIDNRIVFAAALDRISQGSIYVVRPSGEDMQLLASPAESDIEFRHPAALSNGKAVLFTAADTEGGIQKTASLKITKPVTLSCS